MELQNGERIITVREIIDLLLQHLHTVLLFVTFFFCFSVVFVFFKSPVFESTALLKISSENNNDSFLSKIMAGSAGSNYFQQSSKLASEQYILTSRTVLEDAVEMAHLDVVATPWYFPLIGRAIANHHTDFHNISTVNTPFLGLARYNWGGGFIQATQFEVPRNLKGKVFTIIYRGANQYDLYFQDNLLLKGVIGQPASILYHNQPIQILISGIAANTDARFTLEQLPASIAVKELRGELKSKSIPMTGDLLQVNTSGSFNQDMQTRLAAVINSAIQLSIQMHVQKAKKILDFLQKQIPTVKDHLNNLNQAMSNTLPMGVQFSDMAREKSIQNLMYTNMLVDIEQYELQKASSLGGISIITAPTPVTMKILLSKSDMVLIGTLLGFLLGTVYIFARHFILGIVYTNEQLERVTGLSVVGTLPFSKLQDTQQSLLAKLRIPHLSLLAERDENDLTLEGFRSICTHLFLNFLTNPANKVIAVSGPTPGIGKSFISANIADHLTKMNKKVLLIDADIRKGALWEYFCDSRPKVGLIELLKNPDTENLIRKTRIKNLDFLPNGLLTTRNIELLLKDHVADVLQKLGEYYDYIVIDTAPVFMVSDALGLCRHTNVNLLAFAYGKHNERDIDECMRRFEKGNVRVHGVIMNMIPLAPLRYKYGYYYGGYGYREREREKM